MVEHLKDVVVAGEEPATLQNRIECPHVLQHATVVVHRVHIDEVNGLARKSFDSNLRELLVQCYLVFALYHFKSLLKGIDKFQANRQQLTIFAVETFAN
jgi:hypothetical protein